MLAVRLAEADLRPRLAPGLDLAAVNGPGQCVVSGPEEAIAAFAVDLEKQGVGCRRLATSHAFHSAMLDPVLDRFAAAVAAVRRSPPAMPFLSCVTGTWITPEQATDPRYWADHLRHTVRCADALRTLVDSGHVLAGGRSRSTLTNLAASRWAAAVITTLPRSDDEPEPAVALRALGRVWAAGSRSTGRRLHADATPATDGAADVSVRAAAVLDRGPEISPLSRLCGRGVGGEGGCC